MPQKVKWRQNGGLGRVAVRMEAPHDEVALPRTAAAQIDKGAGPW